MFPERSTNLSEALQPRVHRCTCLTTGRRGVTALPTHPELVFDLVECVSFKVQCGYPDYAPSVSELTMRRVLLGVLHMSDGIKHALTSMHRRVGAPGKVHYICLHAQSVTVTYMVMGIGSGVSWIGACLFQGCVCFPPDVRAYCTILCYHRKVQYII